jgi:hypothetical protein
MLCLLSIVVVCPAPLVIIQPLHLSHHGIKVLTQRLPGPFTSVQLRSNVSKVLLKYFGLFAVVSDGKSRFDLIQC